MAGVPTRKVGTPYFLHGIYMSFLDSLYFKSVYPIMLTAKTPWEILGGDNGIHTSPYLHNAELALMLRRGGIALCFLFLGISVVKLLIYHDAKNQAELKQDIKHKLLIIILIASLLTLFDLMKTVFDSVFGF